MGKIGRQSVEFGNSVYVLGEGSVVGKMEGDGPLGTYFHQIEPDPRFGAASWEEAESRLVERTANLAIANAGLSPDQVGVCIGGDLLAQITATSFGTKKLSLPFLGIYSACANMGEALGLAAMLVDGQYAEIAMGITSSHFAGAERQFRFPLPYGNQRPATSTWTVIGGGGLVLGNERTLAGRVKEPGGAMVRVKGFSIGKIVDYGITDAMHMGAVMAPAAADVIVGHFEDFGTSPKDYDWIITGDLGLIGTQILYDICGARGQSIRERHWDCGVKMYDGYRQDVHAGGSGCGCSASVLAGYVLKQLRSEKWKRVLFVPTGALLSTVSFHEQMTIPGIAHAVVLERVD